jgi:hypothetical protein
MSAAILQGVPATTLDTDIWLDLPPRAYLRVLELCRRLGATPLARTTVALRDDSLVNFLYEVDGLQSFAVESKRAVRLRWLGTTVLVMSLSRIIRSKQVVQRPKDVAHLPLLRQTLQLQKRLQRGK